jgi:hypothetical protein
MAEMCLETRTTSLRCNWCVSEKIYLEVVIEAFTSVSLRVIQENTHVRQARNNLHRKAEMNHFAIVLQIWQALDGSSTLALVNKRFHLQS